MQNAMGSSLEINLHKVTYQLPLPDPIEVGAYALDTTL